MDNPMSEPKIFWYDEKPLKDPIAVVGFPSIGLVGSITSSFLARELKLGVVAGITYPDIQQYTLLQNGEAYPPVRVYAGPIPKRKKKKTAEEGAEEKPKKRVKSRDIIIVTSEVAAKPEFTYDFTIDIMDLVRQMGAREIVFADAIPNTDPASMLMGAYSTEGARAMLEENGIPLMKDGIVRGMSGVALYQGKADLTDVICLGSKILPVVISFSLELPPEGIVGVIFQPLLAVLEISNGITGGYVIIELRLFNRLRFPCDILECTTLQRYVAKLFRKLG